MHTVDAARRTPSPQVTDTEPIIDMRKLRTYRLTRLRAEMAKHEVPACVLFNPISVRYASGFRDSAPFATHITYYFLFVAVDGPVILFCGGEHVKRLVPGLESIDELRPGMPLDIMYSGPRMDEWMARWAEDMEALLAKHGGGSRRIALERGGTRAPLALAARGLEVLDAMDLVAYARAIKGPEEILCMNLAIATAEAGMARMREELRPGISEVELWSLLQQENIKRGGDWIECRLLASGDRTNPWGQEASGRMIRPGELVAFDCDMMGPFGYTADISRTFHCGPGRPTPAQRDLYKRAYEEVQHNMPLIRPGLTFREFSEKAFQQPQEFVANRYNVAVHGIGMCDEYPSIYYRQDVEQLGFDGAFEENMTVCVESYVGREGGHEGVKLEEQVLITSDGVLSLSKFPFEEALLR